MSQLSGSPCNWEFDDGLGNQSFFKVVASGQYELQLYQGGILMATYNAFGGLPTDCSTSKTLTQSFSTIGGASTIMFTPT